jgi:hypothetical protein
MEESKINLLPKEKQEKQREWERIKIKNDIQSKIDDIERDKFINLVNEFSFKRISIKDFIESAKEIYQKMPPYNQRRFNDIADKYGLKEKTQVLEERIDKLEFTLDYFKKCLLVQSEWNKESIETLMRRTETLKDRMDSKEKENV